MKKFFLLLSVFAFVGCAYDKDSSTTNTTLERENAKLMQNFNRVVGKYRGTLTTPTAQQDVDLTVSTLEKSVNNGPKRPVLIASFQKTSPATGSKGFEGEYTPETGSVVFVVAMETVYVDDVHTLDLQLSGEKLIGRAKSYTGVIGDLNLSLVSREAAIPREGANEEYKEALRRQFNAIAGTYKGNVVPQPGGEKPFPVVVRLNVIDVATATGEDMPTLVGILHYPAYNTSDLDLTLTANYRPDLNPPTLNISGKPRFPGSTNYVATLHGKLKDDKYTGSFTSTAKGFEGNFVLTKQP